MDVTTGAVLPENCIANILSFTSPPDVCRSSLVSRIFRSAAGSNLVWKRFLPPGYQDIISQSVSSESSSSSSSLNILSNRDLYFHLCENPILIGNGNRSFAIDKVSGKKCYMLGARELSITWSGTPLYWKWTAFAEWPELPKPRFSEVAYLVNVCWLEIRGRIQTKILSPDTIYGAYFIYTIVEDSHNLDHPPVEVSIRFENGDRDYATNAYLKSRRSSDMPGGHNGRFPCSRQDKWMEIEIGEFFYGQVDSMVEMCLMETKSGRWKSGLVVHGIELRPK